jgi:flagellar assembly protein FliH
LPKVYKAYEVMVDSDNKVQIKADFKPEEHWKNKEGEAQEPGDTPEDILRAAEEQARGIVKRARADAQEIIANANATVESELERARHEADALMSDAEARIAAESAQARETARKEGYEEGRAKAEAEGEAIRAEAQKVLDDALRERDGMRSALEPEAVGLVIDIINKLLNDTVALNPGAVVNLIRQGFAGATLTGAVTVRVSAKDYEAVMKKKDELAAFAGGSAEVAVVRDLSLNETDCIIETPFGNIDCGLGQQFTALRANLLHILERPA